MLPQNCCEDFVLPAKIPGKKNVYLSVSESYCKTQVEMMVVAFCIIMQYLQHTPKILKTQTPLSHSSHFV